ncbi:MAG: class I SAM-dependent methyltransferase [Ferruginibacter sp.]
MISDAFIQTECPVCGSNKRKELFRIDHRESNVLSLLEVEDARKNVFVVQCEGCEHKYMNPVIKPELMDKYYSIISSEFYHNAGVDFICDNTVEYADYLKIISKIKPSGKVLEVGCGKGVLLKLLQDNGYQTFGIEPSPIGSKYAKEVLHLDIDNNFLHESRFRNEKFDVIIVIDVVEHILNIQPFLDDLKKVLSDGGLLFIGTGNIDSLNARIAGSNWFYYYTWEHVSFFNVKKMDQVLTSKGFKNIHIRKTSLRHRPMTNFFEFGKNIIKLFVNPFLKKKYYHGLAYDHMIVTAIKQPD